MDNYVKAEKDEEFAPEVEIEGALENVTIMRVKAGSKTKNLIQFAEKKIAQEPQIMWEGSGDAVHKTITCAEIFKKKFNHSLHQITRLSSTTIVETWNPRLDGLDPMRVKRHLPYVKILLAKDPLSTDANGYQAPEDVSGLFDRGSGGPRIKPKSNQNRNKRRNKPNSEPNADRDETLLGDSNKRKDFEKKTKMEKKKKKEAGGGKEQQKQRQQPQSVALPPPDGASEAEKNASSSVQSSEVGESPTLVETSPTLVETSPTLVATSPTLVATSPTLVATSNPTSSNPTSSNSVSNSSMGKEPEKMIVD